MKIRLSTFFLLFTSISLAIGWFLSRLLLPNQRRTDAYRQIFKGFAIVFACGIVAGMTGYLYGIWRGPDADYSAWLPAIRQFQIVDTWAFVRVAYIHNASYLGGLIGFIICLFVLRSSKPSDFKQKTKY